MDDLPHSTWFGSFKIGDVEMKCHTLSDGRRVIEKESVEAFLQALHDGEAPLSEEEIIEFSRWQNGDR